jgi:hydroxymethylpyrimidine kinase/phosphomethylpyrimidine kinase/thiamine-phosphate diphosphorylase
VLNRPIVWTIAGSDSGGGAGIQADLKTINQLGAYGVSVITALTAQNTRGVRMIEAASPEMIAAQLAALEEDLPPSAIKLGMLFSGESIKEIAVRIGKVQSFVVCDPVLVATSGDALALPGLTRELKEKIIPLADLLTPNLEETHALLGRDFDEFSKIVDVGEHDSLMEELASQLLKLGCRAVLVKGGSLKSEFSQDFWTDGKASAWLTSPRSQTRNTHGTGCTLSSAIASAVALGYEQLDAIVIAKAYVNQGLRTSPDLGSAQGPMSHLGWPEFEEDIPWITGSASEGRKRLRFLDCGPQKLGFYPIVDSYGWLEKLLPLGVKTAQLRVKMPRGAELEKEILDAVTLARKYECRLFINDYWELAMRFQAYGVHLGQEDLLSADIQRIQSAGLRLGVSTHCYREVARALALRPSYIAIGPIHATTTKEMKFEPQGIESLKRWRRSLNCPLVAIGGLFLDNAIEAIDGGADGVAVVRDITQSSDIVGRVKKWLALLPYTPNSDSREHKSYAVATANCAFLD